jgi:hypothetical protein
MRRSLSRLTEGAVERHFDVRFTPESGHVRRKRVMSALLLKADMCGATSDVGYGPIADIVLFIRSSGRNSRSRSDAFPFSGKSRGRLDIWSSRPVSCCLERV